jgi:hypothetical protein
LRKRRRGLTWGLIVVQEWVSEFRFVISMIVRSLQSECTKIVVSKSFLRVKFYFSVFLGVVLGILVEFSNFEIEFYYIAPVAAFSICGYFITIRCENCRSLAYRMDNEEHGLSYKNFLIQPRYCPKCGIERY